MLQLLAGVHATEEIAALLCLSEHTVRNGIGDLLTKLGVHTRVEAVSEALRRGLILPEEPELSTAGRGSTPAGSGRVRSGNYRPVRDGSATIPIGQVPAEPVETKALLRRRAFVALGSRSGAGPFGPRGSGRTGHGGRRNRICRVVSRLPIPRR